MGKEDKSSDSKLGKSRKRLRESGSQTDEDVEYVEPRGSASARLDEMNAKLDKVLVACGEIESLRKEVPELREVKSLKESVEFAETEISSLKAKMAQTSTTVEGNSKDIESLDADVEMLKRRNIKLEAYTRWENITIFNIKEEPDENVEERVRSLFVTKLQIPPEVFKAIRFERVHRIPTHVILGLTCLYVTHTSVVCTYTLPIC